MNPTDELRGHDFFPAWLDTVPDLYETENVPLEDKLVHLHYFVGQCDWWVVELAKDCKLAFAYVNLGDPEMAEWGYVDMDELRSVIVDRVFVVERDLDWVPTRFGDITRR